MHISAFTPGCNELADASRTTEKSQIIFKCKTFFYLNGELGSQNKQLSLNLRTTGTCRGRRVRSTCPQGQMHWTPARRDKSQDEGQEAPGVPNSRENPDSVAGSFSRNLTGHLQRNYYVLPEGNSSHVGGGKTPTKPLSTFSP